MDILHQEYRALQAGVARVDITPPVGIRMMGYTVQEWSDKKSAKTPNELE